MTAEEAGRLLMEKLPPDFGFTIEISGFHFPWGSKNGPSQVIALLLPSSPPGEIRRRKAFLVAGQDFSDGARAAIDCALSFQLSTQPSDLGLSPFEPMRRRISETVFNRP